MAAVPEKVEVDVVLKPRTNRTIALALAQESVGYDDLEHLKFDSEGNRIEPAPDLGDERTDLIISRANRFYSWLEGQD